MDEDAGSFKPSEPARHFVLPVPKWAAGALAIAAAGVGLCCLLQMDPSLASPGKLLYRAHASLMKVRLLCEVAVTAPVRPSLVMPSSSATQQRWVCTCPA